MSVEIAGREAGIPSRYLQMLEDGEFPTVADPAYLTHFLRRYARFLGLDAEASARDFLSETEPEATARRTGRVPTPASRSLRSRTRGPRVPGWVAYALVLVAGLTGLFTFVRMQQEREAETHAIATASRPLQPSSNASTRPPVAKAPVPDPVEDAREVPSTNLRKAPEPARPVEGAAAGARREEAEPAPESPGDAVADTEPVRETATARESHPAQAGETGAAIAAAPAPPPREEAPVQAAPVEPPPAVAAATAPPADAATPAAPEPPFELRLTATSRQVWIWVSVDGGPREAVSLEEGESVVFRAERRYVLSVDDAGGIAGSLNGRRLPRFGADAQARRNVVIPSAEFGAGATSRG